MKAACFLILQVLFERNEQGVMVFGVCLGRGNRWDMEIKGVLLKNKRTTHLAFALCEFS